MPVPIRMFTLLIPRGSPGEAICINKINGNVDDVLWTEEAVERLRAKAIELTPDLEMGIKGLGKCLSKHLVFMHDYYRCFPFVTSVSDFSLRAVFIFHQGSFFKGYQRTQGKILLSIYCFYLSTQRVMPSADQL